MTRVGSSAASTIASTPRRRASPTMAWPAVRPRTIAVATSTPAYSSPTSLARASTRFALLHALFGHPGVDRQRHRDLEHVQRLEHGAALVLVGLSGGKPAGGADDVVIESLAEDGHEDAAVLRRGSLLRAPRGES